MGLVQFNLIFFQTADENIMIARDLAGRKITWIGGYRAPGGVRPWTGMWKWTDGSDFNYTNWSVKENEPNNHNNNGEYYITVNWFGPWKWNDLGGDHKFAYVCKCTEK